MAFPAVPARGSNRTTATNTATHAITLPAHQAGDMLLVHFATDGAPTVTVNTGSSSAEWQKLGQASNGTIVTGAVFHLIASGGSETLTLTTSATEQSSHTVLVIRPGSGKTLSIEGTSANGSSTNSNPPNLAPTAGAQDYLWIATRAGDSTVVATVAPTDFTQLQTQAAAGTGGASSNTAERTLNASSLDPGTFTSASEQWVSRTLAVWEVDAVQNESGGASAPVSVVAAGAGTALESSSGGASAPVAVVASGAGTPLEAASGGASAAVFAAATGAGTPGGRIYIVVGPTSTWVLPTAAEVKAGTLSGGATWAGNEAAPTASGTFDLLGAATGLSASTNYTAAAVWSDSTQDSNVYVWTFATDAASEAYTGGASAGVVAAASGSGTAIELASGGASVSIVVAAAGAGTASEATSGGASAGVVATAIGSGTAAELASGGAVASVVATAVGAGTAAESASGGASAPVAAVAAGAGTANESASGGAAAVVVATAAGAGTPSEAATGGAAASVEVAAAGAGTALEASTGGASAGVTVSAVGAGEVSATIYIVIGLTAGWVEPSAADVKAGTLAGGVIWSGYAPAPDESGTFDPATQATGLVAGTNYTAAAVWSDGTTDSNVYIWTFVTTGAEAYTGGASAGVSVGAVGAGAASEAASGGAASTVTVSAVGAGETADTFSGGASANVGVAASGAGTATEVATGGASSTIEIQAAGAGTALEAASGGASAQVVVASVGAGTAVDGTNFSDGASATVEVAASGDGTAEEAASGGASAPVYVSAQGILPTDAKPGKKKGASAAAASYESDHALMLERESREEEEIMMIVAALMQRGVFHA